MPAAPSMASADVAVRRGVLGDEELRDRALRSERLPGALGGLGTLAEPAEDLEARVGGGERLADRRIPVASVLSGERTTWSRNPSGTAPPMRARSFMSVVCRDTPARVHLAEHLIHGDAHVGEERLVEVGRRR